MGQTPIDTILAGTKGFAVALLAPLTAKVGTRPRVAGDPRQVLGLCSGPSSLAVIEFTGEGSLGAVQALVRDGKGVRIVAGLPPAHAGAEGTLRALGVEVGPWDGKVDGVIAAVERALAAVARAAAPSVQGATPRPPPAAAPVVARPAAAMPRPAAPQRPAVSPPRPATAPGAPAAPRAAAPPLTPPVRAAPAAAPIPVRTAPAQPQPSGPPVAPRVSPQAGTRPATPAAQPPGAGPPKPAPAPTAPRVSPPAAPKAPATLSPPPPVLSPAPAQRPPTAAVIAPPPASPATAAPAPAAEPAAAARFFDDVVVDEAEPARDATAPVDFRSPGVYAPPPAEGLPDWPAGICSAAEAEDALHRALHGAVDGAGPLHELTARTLDSLSELERTVLGGEAQPIDAAPIRKAAIMRLRVAEALSSVPPPGSAVDSAALSAVLGEIDALLAEVAPLLSGAPEELKPALEEIRNALVREAIDFSEAAQRVAAAGVQPVQGAPVAPARASAARVLRFDSVQEVAVEKSERRRRWIGFVALGVAVALALAYHGWRQFSRGHVQAQPTVSGAPSNTVASLPNAKVRLVFSKTGKFDPAELQRFKAEQELHGNRVEVVSPGVLKITPAGEPGK